MVGVWPRAGGEGEEGHGGIGGRVQSGVPSSSCTLLLTTDGSDGEGSQHASGTALYLFACKSPGFCPDGVAHVPNGLPVAIRMLPLLICI